MDSCEIHESIHLMVQTSAFLRLSLRIFVAAIKSYGGGEW